MEGVWSVQQITLHWTSRAFANVTSYICLHLFHSEVRDWISYKLLTNFELNNFNQFFSFFSFAIFALCDFLEFVIFMLFGVMLEVLFSDVLDVALPNEENPLFFSRWETNCWHFTTFQKICWKFILSGYFVCRQITAVLEIEILTNIGFLLVLKN